MVSWWFGGLCCHGNLVSQQLVPAGGRFLEQQQNRLAAPEGPAAGVRSHSPREGQVGPEPPAPHAAAARTRTHTHTHTHTHTDTQSSP